MHMLVDRCTRSVAAHILYYLLLLWADWRSSEICFVFVGVRLLHHAIVAAQQQQSFKWNTFISLYGLHYRWSTDAILFAYAHTVSIHSLFGFSIVEWIRFICHLFVHCLRNASSRNLGRLAIVLISSFFSLLVKCSRVRTILDGLNNCCHRSQHIKFIWMTGTELMLSLPIHLLH